MKQLSAFLLLVCLAGASWGVPVTPGKAPAPDAIVLPDVSPPVPPAPPPPASCKLPADVWWVASSGTDFAVLASPEGLVTVTRIAGPVVMRGKFVEDPGRVQTRTYASKYVVVVEAAGTGRCELLIGASLDRMVRRCLDVSVGPPVPPVPPKPPDPPVPPTPPTPPTPIPGVGFHALIVYDPKTETALPKEQQDILWATDAEGVRAYLTAKCAQVGGKADWAIWPVAADPTLYPSPPLKAMFARPRTAVPWIILSNGTAGTFYEGPLPATVADALALVRRIGG